MVKQHLKRIAMPKTWQIKRKGIKFIARPNPGSHKMSEGMSLDSVLKHILKITTITKESKAIVHDKDVLIDGVAKKDHRCIVGILDVVSFPKIKKYYRIILNSNAKIDAIEIDEKDAAIKPCKIKKKTMLKKNKVQVNLSGGRNLIIDKNGYKTGDTLMISLPKQEVKDHIPLEKNSSIFLSGGKHAGTTGKVTGIEGRKIMLVTKEKRNIETLKRYAFVIGKEKPSIKINE